MEVDSWRGEGGFEGGEGGRRGRGEVWISHHQTDRISPTPNNFGDDLRNSKNQQYLSPELEQRRKSSETRRKLQNFEDSVSELGKEGSEVIHILEVAVGDTDDKPGRISGEPLDRFGQNNIRSRYMVHLIWFVNVLTQGGSNIKCCFRGRDTLPGPPHTALIQPSERFAVLVQRCHEPSN